MKQLILTHKHAIGPAALPHARSMADKLRSAGNQQVYLLVADPAMATQMAAEDLAQNPADSDEFAYATMGSEHSSPEEANHVFLFDVLPNFLAWLKPDLVLVVDPALVGWNTVRSVRKALPGVPLEALVTCDETPLLGNALENSIVHRTLLEGALGQFETIRVYPACLSAFNNRHGRSMACKPAVAEPMP
ncbi:MAG TPA: hypothetical protein VFV39_09645 [Limnobacter sp.]|nr:hypothetical protein [Limnobacter sp.]